MGVNTMGLIKYSTQLFSGFGFGFGIGFGIDIDLFEFGISTV